MVCLLAGILSADFMGEHQVLMLLFGLGKLLGKILPCLFWVQTEQRSSRFEMPYKYFADSVGGSAADEGRTEASPARPHERYIPQYSTEGVSGGKDEEPRQENSDLGFRSIDHKLLSIDGAEFVNQGQLESGQEDPFGKQRRHEKRTQCSQGIIPYDVFCS